MHLLNISDLKKEDIDHLLDMAATLKARHKKGIPHNPLRGRTLGLIFEKSSTRTRVSFETAMCQLGGNAIFISQRDSQIGRGEPIKDTARVMSRYVDAVVIRTFGHDVIEEFARYSTIPVINGLTDLSHPCQVLADILTVVEKKGGYKGIKACWIGDGNNMANSWIEAAMRLGFELTLACPKGYQPDDGIFKKAVALNPKIRFTESVLEAAKGADVLNTDVWASMGQEEEAEKRRKAFKGFQINSEVLGVAKKDAMVLHCLPAHREEEITEEVLEGPNSAVWDQAENRLHIQKAILEWLLVEGAR
ncbi:MAG TPA: ornithine carbamoyltransferase [Deltaproteobacteria bacterium]|nr:MAG: ornithine carbamoyltransferase [Deltaproteobacteria bacterium GWA2_55_82]OGQ62403.1 MAG: ornithine carbamoyltransferase [Deltaproteobacteria bacterium RIFCSPLOWO2_02_FULL_55_12]OIJ73315.1 MAG: ornithine carbamoyltransferase [Deltaproteobacteria bacterium GWC2_55_46]HBG45415.1 ornithine carbamoyltransferase [Deltaproteobacteria bacterium]HCY10246.1 ornithine carbamoyltransferase [Deltaproteobacteria bacterium]